MPFSFRARFSVALINSFFLYISYVSACRHHRLVHEGDFGLEAGPNREFRFSRPDRSPLPNAPDGRSRGNFDAIRDANEAEGLEITSHTAYGALDGDPVDWQLAMLELIQRE